MPASKLQYLPAPTPLSVKLKHLIVWPNACVVPRQVFAIEGTPWLNEGSKSGALRLPRAPAQNGTAFSKNLEFLTVTPKDPKDSYGDNNEPSYLPYRCS